MNLEEIFDSSLFHAREIADTLYDPHQKGVLCIPHFLKVDAIHALMQEVREQQSAFSDVREGTYKHTTECKDKLTFIEQGFPLIPDTFPTLKKIHEGYSLFYRQLALFARFSPALINSVDVNRYPVGTGHISPHQDLLPMINLVSIFPLAGKGKLAWCNARAYTEEQEIDTNPGNLILLRAHRNDQEKHLRPWHYVGNVTEERYSLILRQRKQNGVPPGNVS